VNPNSSLDYTPTNDIKIKADMSRWGVSQFLIGNEKWKIASVSLNRGSFIMEKADPKEESYGAKPKLLKKIPSSLGVSCTRWHHGLSRIVSVRDKDEYAKFYANILDMVHPHKRHVVKEIGMLEGSVLLVLNTGDRFVSRPTSGVHLEETVRGTNIKQQYIYLDDSNRMLLPLGYILAAMDSDFGRFCDPFDNNPNKTLSHKEDGGRLLTFHFTETFKEE
jgi:hypothetical protein